jgi:hypothetical protein
VNPSLFNVEHDLPQNRFPLLLVMLQVMAHPAVRSRVKLHQHQESFMMFNEN